MSLTREQIAEVERLWAARVAAMKYASSKHPNWRAWHHAVSEWNKWLAEHGPALLAAARERDALAERVAGLEKERMLHLDLLEDAWYQWSHVIEGHDDSQLCAPRHDMCLSTLEDIRVALFDAGRLVKYAERPEMDWWVRANLIGLGAGASRTEASE